MAGKLTRMSKEFRAHADEGSNAPKSMGGRSCAGNGVHLERRSPPPQPLQQFPVNSAKPAVAEHDDDVATLRARRHVRHD